MDLHELPLDDLQNIRSSPSKLMDYCTQNNLDLIQVVGIIDSLLLGKEPPKYKQPSLKDKPKKSINLEAIVVATLDKFKKESSNVSDFDKFLSLVKLESEINFGIFKSNVPFKGLISNCLYHYAEKQKFGSNKKRIQKLSKLHPVSITDINKFLEIDFGAEVTKHICGILTPVYVEKYYPLQDFEIKYRDDSDKISSNPNIEGDRCWCGIQKKKLRADLCSIVEINIFKEAKSKIKNLEEAINKDHTELSHLRHKLYTNIPSNKIIDRYLIAADSAAEIDFIERNFVKNIKNKLKRISFIKVEKGTQIHIVLSEEFPMDEKSHYIKLLRSEWSNFKISNIQKIPTVHDTICTAQGVNIPEVKIEIGRLNNLITSQKGEIEDLKQISLLSLEGSNFSSYLELLKSVYAKDFTITSIFPEFNHRTANIMESIQASNYFNDYFDDCTIVRRDINDLILLDFVKNTDVSLTRIKNLHKVNYDLGEDSISLFKLHKILQAIKSNPDLESIIRNFHISENLLNLIISRGEKLYFDHAYQVTYKDYQVPIGIYHQVIDELDKGSSHKTISLKYKISDEILNVISDRFDHKFNIVFLDYLSPIYDKKMMALKYLVKKRLGNNVVLAMTHNLSPWHSQQGSMLDISQRRQIPDKLFDTMDKIFNEYGFEATDVLPHEYNDQVEYMFFQAYSLRKKNLL